MRILFIGNSLTARNDLPGLLTEVAASAPEPAVVETAQVLANGASLRLHWNSGIAQQKVGNDRKRYNSLKEAKKTSLPLAILWAVREAETLIE